MFRIFLDQDPSRLCKSVTDLSPVGDEAPVLHGPGGEVRNGDHVVLLERVGHVEEVLVKGEGAHPALQRELALLLLAQRGEHLGALSK